MAVCQCFFFFNDTATTEIYTLSLHDALPIWGGGADARAILGHTGLAGQARAYHGALWRQYLLRGGTGRRWHPHHPGLRQDRKSTRLNSSHANISYAVFCLKKKKH